MALWMDNVVKLEWNGCDDITKNDQTDKQLKGDELEWKG